MEEKSCRAHWIMPSVIVSWTGQCRDASLRGDLCDKLAELARVSDWFLGDVTGVKRFDQQIGGKILLADSALEVEHLKRTLDAEKSLKTSTGLSNLSSAEDLSLDESGRLVHTLKLGGPDPSAIFSLRDAAIWGSEFRLPTIYPDENRVSFVFLLCANPTLNGTVVQVEDKQQCKQFESKAIRGADWFLHGPSTHLRYTFEEWMDFLLGWIRHFYIPDLRYWRYEWLPNYEWLFSKIDSKDLHQRDRLFGILKETLQMECTGWPHIQKDARSMSFWQKVNAIGTLARFPPELLG
jgi:hypothetical protein